MANLEPNLANLLHKLADIAKYAKSTNYLASMPPIQVGELEKELDMEFDKADDVRKRRPKGDAVDYTPSSDDERWEKAKNKPGN